MKRVSIVALLGLSMTLGANVGCLGPAAAIQNGLEAATKAAAKVFEDQAIMDTFAAKIRGDVINPGIQASAGIIAVSTIRMVGVSGHASGSMDGTGTQLPPGMRESMISNLDNVSPDVRDAFLEALGFKQRQLVTGGPLIAGTGDDAVRGTGATRAGPPVGVQPQPGG